ncbi:MAG: hypothetical protein V1720_01085 [bacterium]
MAQAPKNMSQIFEKLNDLKKIFIYGQRVLPIIQSLTEFMEEIVPIIESINSSIADSTLKIPKATDQINNVTNATEMATTEILDLVDSMSLCLDELRNLITQKYEKSKRKDEVYAELKKHMNGNPKAHELLDEYNSLIVENADLELMLNNVNKIHDDSYRITLSLQVQDITAQQLAAVNHLIESVNTKLTGLVAEIEKADLTTEVQNLRIHMPSDAHFDADAKYDTSEKRQQAVDTIVNTQKEKTSQEEIDKLFA